MRSRPLAFPMHFLRPIFVAGKRQRERDEERSLTISFPLFPPFHLIVGFSFYPPPIRARYAIPKIYGRFENVCGRLRAWDHFPGGPRYRISRATYVSRVQYERVSMCIGRAKNLGLFCWKKKNIQALTSTFSTSHFISRLCNVNIIFISYGVNCRIFTEFRNFRVI